MKNKNNSYKTSVLELYRYKLNNKEIYQNQFHNILKFVEDNNIDFIETNLSLFEAYLYLHPDDIIPHLPYDLLFQFFKDMLNLLAIKAPAKIVKDWEYAYFPKLVKSVKRDIDDKYVLEGMRKFFSIALLFDFKKISYKKFKKENNKAISKLKKIKYDFKKWRTETFTCEKVVSKDNELSLLINKGSLLVQKALGTKKTPGIAKNSTKLYSKLCTYLNGSQLKCEKSLVSSLEVLKNVSYDCSKEEEILFRDEIENYLNSIKRISKLPEEILFSFWQRIPNRELFIGSKIDTCLSVSRGSFFCLLEYFMDFFINVVIIKDNENIIGLSYVVLVEEDDGRLALLFDNVELIDEYKGGQFFTKTTLEYFKYITKNFNFEHFYLGMNYNDVILENLEVKEICLKKFGLKEKQNYYLDAFGGYGIPEGRIRIYKVKV